MEGYAIIGPIMERHGARCGMEEFHSFLNLTFHEFESESYDELHAHMWESLPPQFNLLIEDCLRSYADMPGDLRVLDIGCGTGLASDSLFKTAIGSRIRAIDLLDISPEMLKRASQRASRWPAPATCHRGLIDSLPKGARYEVVVTCSVLHHIPDLPTFLQAIRKLQADGGVFLHLQDPNGDFLTDPELRQRRALLFQRALPEWVYRFAPRRIAGRIYRELTGKQGQDYISKTNRALLEKGLITTPLSVAEIFAITDIHAQEGQGISMCLMQSWMPEYECLSRRSYAFFGRLANQLPPKYRKIEEDLIRRRALNGQEVSAIWRLRPAPRLEN
jgi:2-polyprenyl-3-methyl-5-hydroxy-6-metoxy-1,4-benzoquinol methylase